MDFSEYNEVVRAWMNEVLRNRGVNAELTLKYCADIEQYGTKLDDAKLLGFACYYSGETYYVLNDVANLFRYITRAITYLDQSEQWEMVARAYNVMAITSLNRGNAPIAMDYYLTGLSYCKKYHLYQEENMIHLNLGNLYLSNGQYSEAQKYFERVQRYVKEEKESEDYYSLMSCISVNLGKCYLLGERSERAQEYVDYIDRECWAQLQKPEQLDVLCFKTHFYHAVGRISMRDECIAKIHEQVDVDMAVMDVFDDFYELCQLLLEIGNEDAFWDILNILEELTKNAKIINLQRRIISLKIKYYRRHHDSAGYLQATGLYYELTEVMERENQYMIANMLAVRSSLEQSNEKRREIEQVNATLQEKSETDPLTHLANRFRLNSYSEQAFERALCGGKPFAVEILDIDYFKEYNDNYGHQAGDECIVMIADELKKMQDGRIFCARYGGDEFVIIYEGMTEKEVFAEAENLRERILARKLEHAYSKALPIVTISQGICVDIPAEETRSWDFLHAADNMLYQVKKQSRNNIALGRLEESEIRMGY
ncbi:MAG: diguanylate cyclase [Clostridiales bacterium]|nr:diguanylate cyclase [Roseburia sp.]MDD7635439.1 diguanylate cyclase [Clostridiales bacterium]MDY4111761.1 tetratricopeptide repeat-containing diguanylate cyclase [Roseburia sp.]